jgi:hypothetical protein
VHLADQLSLATGHGYALEPAAAPVQDGTLEILGIQDTFLSHVQDALPERVHDLQTVLADT